MTSPLTKHLLSPADRATAGTAGIDVPAAEAGEFLRRPYALVPVGAESLHIDVDGALAALIDSCD